MLKNYLDDGRVSEGLIQDVHLTAELQSVDYEVLLSGGDLHQTSDAQKAPVGVMLQWTTGPSITVACHVADCTRYRSRD